ncbi:STAS/SEC14 domain-containing protein [Kordia algicida OT-1]|nr:STAS/SEC14 domain-containing protein [Kordia algicida]
MHSIEKVLKDIYTFENGKLYLYEDLIIGEINEGVHITTDVLLSFFEFFHENYKVPFGYISYRKNSYSIDPQVYKMLPENNLLKGIAVVTDKKFSVLNAHVEKSFFNGKYELFTTLNAAINWLDKIIPLEKNNASISDNTVV